MSTTSSQPDASPAAAAAPEGRPKRGMGTLKNMVISMLVVLAFVVVWIAMVPRPNAITQPPVDVTSVAQQVRAETHWPILQPRGLPAGWRATSVRFVRSTDGLMTWHAGYQSPDGNYVAVEQTRGATQTWVEAQTNRGRAEGTVEAGGTTWTRIDRKDKVQFSLVSRGRSAQDLTTIVTGTAPYAELAAFAEKLQPVS